MVFDQPQVDGVLAVLALLGVRPKWHPETRRIVGLDSLTRSLAGWQRGGLPVPAAQRQPPQPQPPAEPPDDFNPEATAMFQVPEALLQEGDHPLRHGRRQVVRNGHLPERAIQTGIGAVEVQQPRVRDRRPADQREAFTSAIPPPMAP